MTCPISVLFRGYLFARQGAMAVKFVSTLTPSENPSFGCGGWRDRQAAFLVALDGEDCAGV